MADGVNDRYQVRREHAEWSQATFGNVGPVGPLKHLAKEAIEAAAEPDDLSEWADMQFLMWDAQRRAGITDEQITLAMVEKLAVNKQRSWPEPKEGEPRLHIKEQPAPVVPEKATVGEMPFLGTSEGAYVRGWNDCRAAMLQPLHTIKAAPALCSLSKTGEVLHANSPVVPEGYVMVPKEPTKEMIDAGWLHFMGAKNPSSKGTYKAMLAAADCSIPMISDRWIPVSERVPTKQDGSVFLTWNGQYIGKELFLMGSFQCLKPEIITHWMQLPAAPQEVKSES
ncbi:dATP/dGTP pyrophosphohydrolase domain-containing protein [Klebsiella michiganensis]|uniref:dATP/dGTP pyrophosphohydrolase domain-containing protein n=1 Tax=Klebsiella michiganensis TaxID=1134687 RepID=UPI0039844838